MIDKIIPPTVWFLMGVGVTIFIYLLSSIILLILKDFIQKSIEELKKGDKK